MLVKKERMKIKPRYFNDGKEFKDRAEELEAFKNYEVDYNIMPAEYRKSLPVSHSVESNNCKNAWYVHTKVIN